MAAPKTKQELLDQSRSNYQKLLDLIGSLSDEKQNAEFRPGTMNRNIRDVLAHLHHWHLMFMSWYEIGMAGGTPNMPATGYSWKDTKALNRSIWEQYRHVPLEKTRKLLDDSHRRLMDVIRAHTNEELFEKKRYSWTGTSSLATYIRSNTSSHYNWAYKLIRRAMK